MKAQSKVEIWRKMQSDIKAFDKIKQNADSIEEIIAVAFIEGQTTYK